MSQFSGVCTAVVIDNVDPDNVGRVKVRLPQLGGPGKKGAEAWARIATLMAGNNRGTWFIPDVNDEVLVAFEAGDTRRPFVIGALWNGTDSPPETMDASNSKKVVRTRGGVKITLDDQHRPGGLSRRDAGWPAVDVERRSRRGRDQRQQRQFGEARDIRRHRDRLGEGDHQRQRGGGRCGHAQRKCRHVEIQRRRAVRRAHQQQRRQRELQPRRGKYMVTNGSVS